MPKNTGKPYEKLTKRVFEAILAQQGVTTVEVQHDVSVQGRSTRHQIDVYWKFRHGPAEYTTLVQCKDEARPIDQGEVLKFKAVLDDVPGQPRGIMASRAGFQSGARDVAQAHGILLYELRETEEADWEGRVRNIIINLNIVTHEYRNHTLVPDAGWVAAECSRHGLAQVPTLALSGRSDTMVFEDESGQRIGSVHEIVSALRPTGFEAQPWKLVRHTFPQPAFISTGDASLPRLKVEAYEVEVMLHRDQQRVEIRGDAVVQFILKNVLEGSRVVFDKDVKPLGPPKG